MRKLFKNKTVGKMAPDVAPEPEPEPLVEAESDANYKIKVWHNESINDPWPWQWEVHYLTNNPRMSKRSVRVAGGSNGKPEIAKNAAMKAAREHNAIMQAKSNEINMDIKL